MPQSSPSENSANKIIKAISYAGIIITILAWLGAGLGYLYSLTLSNELSTKVSMMTPRDAVQLLSIAYGWITCGIGFLLSGTGLFLQAKVKGLKLAFIMASIYFLPITLIVTFAPKLIFH